ncbi:uncharacterized protein GIQ15_00356 [Arthroderma uncinatum]|uniref:uncharacterized protein n=1 Tax=Arthroderma uncinatum TaxID=74035 RepID=UPI00144A7C03|nr:uncharacterized protein GIQ15_00356 [Arthroderma uncinatum]KAF3490839.1 hypothetical protein GIQ15_00356 [Arthroderma uncinatum]
MQSSQLLSCVPHGSSPEDFLMNVGPKLLSLLDGDDMDLKKTASYIIGNGILAKRPLGAPGTIGFTIFVKTIFDAFHGNLRRSSHWWLRKFNRDGLPTTMEASANSNNSTLADEHQLSLSLNRLTSLTTLHPNPALLKRLIGPVLLPLWGLHWYAKSHKINDWAEQTYTLLQNFFSVSSEKARFEKLISHIMWDGGDTWSYKHDMGGGISMAKRDDTKPEQVDIIQMVGNIDGRIDSLIEFLGFDPQRETLIGEIFLFVSRNWLIGEHESSGTTTLVIFPDDIQADLKKVIYAKITEKVINQYKDVICRQPEHTLELVDQLVDSELQLKGIRDRRIDTSKPTLQSIGSIVEKRSESSESIGTIPNSTESSESLVAALSLLSTILTSPDFELTEEISPLLEKIKSKLDHLLLSAPPTLKQSATTACMLLEFTISGSLPPHTKHIPKTSHISDIEAHRHALNNLNSPLPPVQAEGLSLLSQLVMKSSPILDIPATLTTLLSLILKNSANSNDEFVYLNVIKLIGTLASKHPRTVISTLAERYRDNNEEATLDERLRIGEALLRTVQELGDALVGDTAKVLGDTMVSVAGRRGTKPKANDKRKAEIERQRIEEDEASDIEDLGVEAADLMNQMDEQTDSESEDPVKSAYSKKILQAWAAGAVSDENPDDLRVRTSAISILASAIQTNLSGLGQRIASASVDMALSTLTLEPGPENAIIRRAAAVLLLDLITSLDQAIESGNNPGFTFSHSSSHGSLIDTANTAIGNIPDILRVLVFVESKETDTIVRGHIRVLVESLEAWTEKSILRGIGANTQPRFELGDRLAGLDIEPLSGSPSDSLNKRGHPRIEEIE